MKNKTILAAIKKVESNHFRTVHDTGAAEQARLVWNALRSEFGLPRITMDDLAKWDGKSYVVPHNSNLLTNPKTKNN